MILNLRSSAAQDLSLKERKSLKWLVFTKLKAIKNPGLDLSFTWV